MKLSVVIPNFNSSDLLKKNLAKILSVVGGTEVVVVDDASTDDSVEEIKYQISNIKNTNKKAKIKLIQNEKNLGFASTVNRGVNKTSGELVVLLNTDVYPEKDFLKAALPHFNDPKVFAVGFLQKCPEKGKVVLRGRGVGKFEKGFLLHDRGAVIGDDTSEVSEWTPRMVEESKKTLWVSGGAGIFRRSIWEKLGGLDTLYNPFYWEDIDLSYRALKAGYKLFFQPKSGVYHDQKQGAIRSNYTKNQVNTIAYRNQILFVWLNITDISLLLAHLIYLPYHLIKSLIRLDFSFPKAFLLAILKLPQVISHRVHNQKLSIISDKEIMSPGNYPDV